MPAALASFIVWASTPSTLGVAAGPHQLSVKKDGFKPWERTIPVSSGHIKIDAPLEF